MTRPQHIVNWFYEQEFNRAWLDFDDFLIDAIQDTHDRSRASAEEYASNNSDRLWNKLRQQIADDRRRGFYPTFAEITSGVKRLFWFPNFFPVGLSKSDKYKRIRIRSRTHISQSIKSMNNDQFEALSVLICKLSGAAHYSLTPRIGGDQGVDFFALLPSLGRSHIFSGGTGPIRIVGQCKKHASSVSVGDVRQFGSTLEDVRKRSPEVKEITPNWFLGIRGPIVGWFISHSGLQSGARDYSNNNGIIHSDSKDLAEVVTMSRAWQPSEGLLAPVELMYREIDTLLT